MTALVLDASAALVLTLGIAGGDEVRARLRDRIAAGEPILVPALFWLEIIDGLVGGGQAPDGVVEVVFELEQLGLETAEVGRPGVLATIDAVGRGLTARAAAYLVLAEASNAQVLTATPSLAAVAGDRAILVGARASGRARRRMDRSWVRWKGAAAYLRELRSAL